MTRWASRGTTPRCRFHGRSPTPSFRIAIGLILASQRFSSGCRSMPSDKSPPTHDQEMQIVVIGADGRLGGVLFGEFVTGGYQVTGLTLSDLDITDAERVAVTIERL